MNSRFFSSCSVRACTAIATFERNYKKADRASLLSWDVYTPYADTTLSSIAAETGMSTADIEDRKSVV